MYTQVGARGDDFLIEKERDDSQVGREHWCVIDWWIVIFQFKNGPGWAVPFQFENCFEISNEQSFSSSENGPDWMVIFIIKMVQ